MFDHDPCPRGDHRPPKTGGSCPCGMVTRIPARRTRVVQPSAEVVALLAQCLQDGSEALDAAAADLLRERADRLLSALTTAGLVLGPGAEERLSA